MTFSAVGTVGSASGSSFTLDPATIGDFILAEVYNYSNSTVTCTGLSSTNVTWAPLTASVAGTNNNQCSRVFIGTVTSAAAATVTVSWSGTAPGCMTGWQEFASTNGAASVALDGTQQAMLDNAAGTATWPSLTPAGSGELYFGYTGYFTYAAGTTSGYVYQDDGNGQGMAYNLSCAAGTPTAPVWGSGAQMVFGVVVLVKDAPSGVSFTATPGSADGTGAAYGATGAAGAATSVLYAGSATGISGSWSGTGNATGSGQGTYATWTDSAAGSSAVLELASFGAQAPVPAGSAVTQVNCTVRHGEAPATSVASVTAQAYSGSTPVGSPQPLTAADAVHDDQVTFTGLTWADLADLRVRVTVTRD